MQEKSAVATTFRVPSGVQKLFTTRAGSPCGIAACLMIAFIGMRQEVAQPHADDPAAAAAVHRDTVLGSINHYPGREWDRISGVVTVIDSHTVEFADGTRLSLDLVSPDLQQRVRIDGEYYPAGQEAADFLRELIGDQSITCYLGGRTSAFVGDTNIRDRMLINGWALADHSSEHPAEIIARENKRGLWRGEFVNPEEWRNGVRLTGETE